MCGAPGIRGYMARHAYQNTRTERSVGSHGAGRAKGLDNDRPRLHDAARIPLIQVGASHCASGQTVATAHAIAILGRPEG